MEDTSSGDDPGLPPAEDDFATQAEALERLERYLKYRLRQKYNIDVDVDVDLEEDERWTYECKEVQGRLNVFLRTESGYVVFAVIQESPGSY